MKKAYKTFGKDGLVPRVRRKPKMPNCTSPMLEQHILFRTLRNPLFSYLRLAAAMKSEGIGVSPSMVRYVWQRHDLTTRLARLQWIDKLNGGADRWSEGWWESNAAMRAARATAAIKASKGHTAIRGKPPRVDWTYWARCVQETLAK
jgi:hypothetical protein